MKKKKKGMTVWEAASKGGKNRAKNHTKEQLSRWGRRGGLNKLGWRKQK